MGRADYYAGGDYNGICDHCGCKFKFSKLKYEWDGLYVCERCWDYRNPQDYVRGVRDNMSVPISRPPAPNDFIQPMPVTEIPVITLSFIKSLLKSLAVSVSSTCYLRPIKYPKTSTQKVVNGFALNTTTLG